MTKRFKLNHIVQVPTFVSDTNLQSMKRSLIKIDVPSNINSSWSLKQIVNWAGSKI
jgi:hypothetical protein